MVFGFRNLDMPLLAILLTSLSSSSAKTLEEHQIVGNDIRNTRIVGQAQKASPLDSLPVNTLTEMLGCNLPDAVNLLLCSSSNNKESFHSTVHYPTKVLISQLGDELSMGSINKPQAVEKISNAIRSLNSVLDHDKLFSSSTGSSSNSRLLSSQVNFEQMMTSVNQLVSNQDNIEKSQRRLVQTVSSMPRQLALPPASNLNSGLEPAPVLERPPLASAVEPSLNNADHQPPPQLPQNLPVDLQSATSNQQRSRATRDTSSMTSSDNALKSISLTDSQSCALSSVASTRCSPTDVQDVLQTVIVTFATAITDIKDARSMLLNNVLQAPACSTSGVAGNQMAWASLGTSERSLTSILSTLLNAREAALEKQQENINKNTDAKNLEGLNSLTSMSEAIPPGASHLLTSSMGQFSSAASNSFNQNSMDSMMKSLGDGQKKLTGLFSMFG